jgi:hypothetical protein
MMKVDGSCHCGKIKYRAEVDPEDVQVCHCTDCQVLTGSPYRVSAPAPAPTFELIAGTPKIYVKKADDGTPRAQGFCGDCGTPLYSAAVKDTPLYYLRVGSIRQRHELAPKRQIWRRSAVPWSSNISLLPALETD